MQIRIVGTANTAQARAQFAALTAQVTELNAAMVRTSMIPAGGSPAGFGRAAAGAREASNAWSTAMAASGAYRVEQLRINDSVSKHTELLQRQKLGFRETFGRKSKMMMREVYREQLRMNNAQMQMVQGGIGDGSMRANMAVPTGFVKSWDTASSRVGFFRQRLASASSELINWGKNTQWAGRQLMAGLTMPVAAFGAAAGVMAYQTDKAMAKIVKVYDFSAAAQEDGAQREKEAAQLRIDSLDNAREAARKYGAAVAGTLGVQQELAATGLSGKKLMTSTNEVQRISTIGDIDPSQTTEMIVALQTAFRDTIQDGDDLSNTLNFMNAASNATSLSLQDIAESTPRAASALSSLGVTAEEMTILLVSMRENGVNAAEGANALKSATTRILNPVKKAVSLYDQYNINIKALSEQSGGNLFEFLKLLGKEQGKINGDTQKQTEYMRAQGIATLFGTYQYNRLNASLVNLGDAYNGVQNQTSKAIDLMGLSTEELAQRADASLKDITATASGRFKIAIETLKADMAQIGQPFLEVATVIVKAVSAIVGFVNKMPGWAKKGLIFALMLGAIVGPVVMLIGLFANFAGNIGKFAAFLMRATTSWRVMDKAQWAAKVSADLAAKGFNSQTTSSEVLTAQIRAQTLALEQMAMAYNMVPGVRHAPIIPAGVNNGQAMTGAAAPAGWRPGQAPAVPAGYSTANYTPPVITRLPDGRTETAARLQARAESAERAARATQRQANAQAIVADRAAGTTRSLNGANLAMGTMGIAMAGMMISSGAAEGSFRASVGHFSKWLLIASIVVPAVKLLVGLLWSAVAASAAWVGKLYYSTIAYAMINRQAAGQVGLLGMMTAGALGFGKALNLAMGPVGWIALGLTAVAGTLFFINKHNKAIEEAQRRQVKNGADLVSQTDEWAAAQEDAVNKWRRFQDEKMSVEAEDKMRADVEWYKSDEQKEATGEFSGLGDVEQDNILMLKYANSIKTVGLTSQQAEQKLIAFLFASGMGLQDATNRAAEFRRELGTLEVSSSSEWLKMFGDTFDHAADAALGGNAEKAKNLGEQGGRLFREGFTDPKNSVQTRQAYYADLKSRVLAPWEDVAADIRKFNGDRENDVMTPGDARIKDVISSGDELRTWYLSLDKDLRKDSLDYYSETGHLNDDFSKAAAEADNLEMSMVGGIRKAMDMAAGIDHLGELFGDDRFNALTMSLGAAEEEVERIKASVADSTIETTFSQAWGGAFGKDNAEIDTMTKKLTDAEMLSAANKQNAFNAANGYKKASNNLEPAAKYAKALSFWGEKTTDEMFNAARGAERLTKNLKGIDKDIAVNINLEDSTDILKEGMSGVQSDISDMLSDEFDASMDNAIEKQEGYWDNRIQALEDSQQKASDRMESRHDGEQKAFENRWERRSKTLEAAYDKRIDNVNKAIEAEQKADEIRQKIFEAEQTRLDRLTEGANRTIDFNIAMQTGDIDEAAKIRNDMDAAAQGWALSDAGEAGTDKSAKRQEKLGEKAENIGNKKDAAIEALQKREDAEKEAMERRQDNEKKHLQKVQELNKENLQDLAELRKKEYAAEWDSKKDSLQDQLELFKSFVPKNQKQLEQWMKKMGITYENFGNDKLKPKSEKWGKWYKNSLTSNIHDAGIAVASDNMWEKMGKDMAVKTLNGMGFSFGSFKKFIATGELPAGFGKPIKPKGPKPKEAMTYRHMGSSNPNIIAGLEGRHEGGFIGSGKGSRKGVAKNLKSLHSSETLVNARKGEFMVNKNSAAKYGPELNAINNGVFDQGVMGGAGPGFAGIVAGAIGSVLSMGLGRALQNAAMVKYDSMQATGLMAMTGANFGAAKAGSYGNTEFSSEQLDNARVIANVGKTLGASSRDIVIALMTAMQESTLRNLDYGDRDSVGLFQQRDAWGSFADRTNPAKSAKMFFTGGAQGQRGLFDFPDRDTMSLAEAAQSVQVSAFPDAYAKWSDEAQSIYKALSAAGTRGTSPMGPGGRHVPIKAPSSRNLHGTETGYPAYDFSAKTGTPIYAVSDGVISRSYDISGPLASDSYRGDGPYGSYGRVMYLKTDAGPEVLYAHLSHRGFDAGQRVTGGTEIGKSGNTGNSSGSHLHFGATNGPLAWLKTGGQTLNDGMAMLHRGETVLTKPLTDDLNATVKVFGKSSKEILSGRRGGNREGQMEKAKTFARNQVGKPYSWGGVGPGGYDCSGLQSALVNVIKGNHPYSRLFSTGSMGDIVPGLGFKKGNGGKSDYSVGWRTGSPGHTSGRIGDYPIESTGNAVRSKGATPVGAFTNQWHLPLSSIAANTTTNPNKIDTKGKDKTPVVPWTRDDGFNSSSESWSEDKMKADASVDTGFWTYTSGLIQNAVAATQLNEASAAGNVKAGTYNVLYSTDTKATKSDLSTLMGKTDVLALSEFDQAKQRALMEWVRSQGWGIHGSKTDSAVTWNAEKYDALAKGNRIINRKTVPMPGGGPKDASYVKLRNKENGTTFWQIAAHTMSSVHKSAQRLAVQTEQFNSLRSLTEELSGSAPVILGGDLNADPRRGKALKSLGMGNINRTDITYSQSFLDHMLTSAGIKASGQKAIKLNSDHKALLGNFAIPSHKDGAQNIRFDNTLANLHRGEGVLTEAQNTKFRNLADNIDNVATGGSNEYNIKVEVNNPGASADEIAGAVMRTIQKAEARKPQRRRS